MNIDYNVINKKGRNYMEKLETMKIRLQGDNDVDLETLTSVLTNTLDSLKIIADNVVDEDDFCKFKVNNIERGSFVIDISTLTMCGAQFAVAYAEIKPIISCFKEILEIKNFLKGKNPTEIKYEGNDAVITNAYGEVNNYNVNTLNIYTSEAKIDKCISKMATALYNDPERTGLSIETDVEGDEELLNVPKEKLLAMSQNVDVESMNENIKEEINTVWLKVSKVEFDSDAKWDFTMLGRRISADILDKEFHDKVKKGETQICANTKIRCQLRARYKADSNGDAIAKKISYSVLTVIEFVDESVKEFKLV